MSTLPLFVSIITHGRFPPVAVMILAMVASMAPWSFQRQQRLESPFGPSPMEKKSERFWLGTGLILSLLIVPGFLYGKHAGWFAS